MIKKTTKAIAQKIKKVSALPKLEISKGKINCTTELINELTNAIKPIAKPLICKGKSSDNNTHITGPN